MLLGLDRDPTPGRPYGQRTGALFRRMSTPSTPVPR